MPHSHSNAQQRLNDHVSDIIRIRPLIIITHTQSFLSAVRQTGRQTDLWIGQMVIEKSNKSHYKSKVFVCISLGGICG